MGQPRIIRITPITIATPTDTATVYRKPAAYASCALIVLLMTLPFAAKKAALSAIAIKAGSAIVVPKPSANANTINQNTLPFLAKSYARFSPTGNRPISRPLINRVKPIDTNNKPTRILARFGMGCCKTINWKNTTTRMIGSKSLKLLNNRMKICFIMYTWERVNPKKDSSLRIIHVCVSRGHESALTNPINLAIRDSITFGHCNTIVTEGKVKASVASFHKHIKFEKSMRPLGEFDVIFMRANPPLDPMVLNFLDSIKDDVFIINTVQGLRKESNKIYTAESTDPKT